MTNASPVRALSARICSDRGCRGSNASRVIATVTPGAGSGVSVILRMLGLSWGSLSTGRTHRYRLILPGATVIDSGWIDVTVGVAVESPLASRRHLDGEAPRDVHDAPAAEVPSEELAVLEHRDPAQGGALLVHHDAGHDGLAGG